MYDSWFFFSLAANVSRHNPTGTKTQPLLLRAARTPAPTRMTHDGHDEKRQPQNANKLETQPKPKLLTKASKHTPRLLTKAIKPTRFTAKGASA